MKTTHKIEFSQETVTKGGFTLDKVHKNTDQSKKYSVNIEIENADAQHKQLMYELRE